MMLLEASLVLATLCAACSGQVLDPRKPDSKAPNATIDAGTVIGIRTSVPSAPTTVNKFLGIPFAVTPPTRFLPPEPVKNFSAPINATAWSPACIQQFNYPEISRDFTIAIFDGMPPPQESEDCLYLNVYAPATSTPGKAVMFWIYGGALQFGNAGQAAYDGSSFAANQDVIVVSANYRTNAFGFSNSPQIPLTERNVGFLDQRLALNWVQRNIHAFGGDPAKVTIFGESAGASSVDRLVTTLPVDPPFRAAITESGQARVSPAPLDAGPASWASLVAALNCTAAISQLACVQAAPATTIQSIIEHAALSFSPVTDNITQKATPLLEATLMHQIATVPYMTGNNGQEGRVFQVAVSNASTFAAFINATFPESTAFQQEILAAYPLGSPGLDTYFAVASQIYTDYIFQCPAYLVAQTSANASIPTYRYYYNATIPNIQPPIPGIPALLAYHSSEIPLVFGTYPTLNVTTQEIKLSKYMQRAWARFAKDPAAGPGWVKVNGTGGKDVACLGCAGSPNNVSIIDETSLDARCALYEPIYAVVNAPAF